MKNLLKTIIFFLIITTSAFAQTEIEGLVINESRTPINGATVALRGTTSYTVADAEGKFKIEVPDQFPLFLRVSSIGYKPELIRINDTEGKELEIILQNDNVLSEIVVTSRRRKEVLQDVPIPITVIGGGQIERSGAFNVNRAKELIPSIQLYSSNPRNTTLNIRGLGSTFGLTNDGIDPGVGFYVDGVYYARPAATTLDFIDVEQIEVLRGPQGTLFGKNTTAGAFNVTTRKPAFSPGASFETSFGNYGYLQAKVSITGPLRKNIAGRLSFSGTQRDGVNYNRTTQQHVNDLNNLGLRGQILVQASDKVDITFAGDFSRQRPNGYAHVVAGVVTTQRADYRQFSQIIADLGYELPSNDPFDRVLDHNTSARANNDLGGASINVDAKIGSGTLTSTTAWRFWNWNPSSDRDYLGLDVFSLSQAPSKHQQWSQEIRYAGEFSSRLSGVFGVFAIGQTLKSDDIHTEEAGSANWRFAQNTDSPLWQTPGLFDGFGINTYSKLNDFSGAIFAQVDWEVIDGLHLLPGLRYNYDKKKVNYDRQTYGGLQTDDPELLALKNAVYNAQAFTADADDANLSGQITLAYKALEKINAFATYATSYKPVGVNIGGLPRENGETMIELAQIKPEHVSHLELGIKTSPTSSSTLNMTVYNTDIKDFQAQVQTPDPSVNRGYLANAEKVRVRGLEFDGSIRLNHASFYGSLAYTDGKYISFTNAPVPLEETGSPEAFKDISGGRLPGISKWSTAIGGEVFNPIEFLGQAGEVFGGIDTYYRSDFSSSPSPSNYLNIDGYFLLNARVGFRANGGLSVFVWSRNILDQNYFEQLLPMSGGSGMYAGVLGDPRTFGLTLRYDL